MGAAVGAALKKIAVAILTDPKVLKKVGGIVIGIIVIICIISNCSFYPEINRI